MNMREWSVRRRIITVLAVLASLVVVAAIAVPFLVPAERWKALAFEQLERRTKLVGTAETASVSLFPLGLKLGGLRIEDPQGVTELEDFEFELERAVVRASLGSILRGAPSVQEIRLVKPRLEFGLSEVDGTTAEAEPSEDMDATQPASADLALVLSMLVIEDGQLIVHDPAGMRIEVAGLKNRASLRTSAGSLSGEMRGEFERIVVSSDSLPAPLGIPHADWELQIAAPLDGSGGEATVESFEIAGARAVGRVGWQTVTDSAPVLDLDLDVTADVARLWTELLRDQVGSRPLPAPWTIDDLELTGGELTLDVVMQGAVPAADPDDAMAALRPFRIDGQARGVTTRVFDRTDLATLDAKIGIANAELRVDDARLTGALGTAQAAFRVGLALTEPLRGDATADLDLAALRSLGEQWRPKFAALDGAAAGGSQDPQEWPQLQGRVQATAKFAVAADGSFDPLTAASDAVTWTARSERFTARMPTIEGEFTIFDARMRGDLAHANVEQARVEGPGVQANAVLELSGWPKATIVRGDVSATRIDLDALQDAMAAGAETAWLGPRENDSWLGVRTAYAQKAPAQLPPPPPPELDVDVRLAAGEVYTAGYTLREVGGTARLVQQQLEVTEIAGKLGAGNIGGEAGLDWTVDPPAWKSDLRASEVPASALLEPVAGPLSRALTTNFSGEVRLDGPVAIDPLQIIAALSGDAALRSTQGTFAAESLLGPTVSAFLGQAAEKWRAVDFSALTANVSVNGGRVHFDRVFLAGATELGATGSVGLDGTSAYRIDVRLPRGVTPDLGALQPVADLLRDGEGRIAFGVNVSGDSKRPKVEIDMADLQRRVQSAGEDRVRAELRDRLGVGNTQDAQAQLEDVLGTKLDDLLGGSRPAPAVADSAAADSAAVDPQKTLEDQAKDAADDLLDRLKGRKKGGGGEE